MSQPTARNLRRLLPLVLAVASMWAAAWAAGTSGDLYFTTYKGGADVNKISFNYDGTK